MEISIQICIFLSKKKIFFVNRKFNKKIIFDKINYLLNLDENIWDQELTKSNTKIYFDKDNSILKKKSKRLLRVLNENKRNRKCMFYRR